MKKRTCRLLFGVLVLLALQPRLAAAQRDGPVRVQGGLLSGGPGVDGAVTVFKGIPYAAPPVGVLRWRPPQAPSAWEGVRAADQFSASCIQNVVGSRPPWTEEFMVQGAVSEDCLYLNVWTAAEEADEAHPVLVYVHGGGFSEGSGSVAIYDGEALARKGLVVVTINYRVGPLGFLAHPSLTEESDHDASGNYGMLDQVAALAWVKQNIAAFGGDPSRVTIAGQSAGAMSVYLLTASPLAKGLFHRAIVESGPGALASFGVTSARDVARPLAEAEQAGAQFAAERGAASLQALRALSVDEIMAPSAEGRAVRFGPVVDGWFLPDDVDVIYAAGQQHDVPTLSGMNADEASAFPGYGQVEAAAFKEQARERYGDQVEAFLALYPAETDEAAGASQKASGRDMSLVAMRRLAADRAKTAKTNAYLYYFDRAIPWPEHPAFAAFHTGEVPYVFNNLDLLDRPWEAVDRNLADIMSSYWVNFAASGDPNGPGVPSWPAFTPRNAYVMRLGDPVEAKELPDPKKAAFFQRYLEQRAAR